MSKVAFIGLGRMGGPMAGFILEGGHQVTAFDLDKNALGQLIDQGASSAASAEEAATGADFVITSLPDPPVVERVYFGENGLINHVTPGSILIDTSTSSPALARRISQAAEQKGAAALDAPVSGGPMGAQAGTLAVMIGGDEGDVERALPIVELFGKTIRHMGGPGAGQVTKLINNLLAGCYMASISEAAAVAIGERIDPLKLFEVLSNGTGNSRVLHTRYPVPGALAETPASNNWEPLFPVDLAAKDLDLALSMAGELGLELPMTSTARKQYAEVQEQGNGGLDYSAVARLLQEKIEKTM